MYSFLLGENFALKKPTKQSQTTHGGSASKAVDGNKNRQYFSGSCTHTDEETTPWWRVDLEQRIAVTHVKIANRDQIGKRLCGFEIRVGDSLENNGITNPRCGFQQHIPSNQVKIGIFFSRIKMPREDEFLFSLSFRYAEISKSFNLHSYSAMQSFLARHYEFLGS